MALFPASPVNGQTTVVNGITYTYSSSQTAWIRTGSGFTSDFAVGGNGTFGGNVTANGFIGNLELIKTTWNQGTGVLQVVGNAGISGTTTTSQIYNAGNNNLMTYSSDFSNIVWIPDSGTVSFVTDATTAPDGTVTADLMKENNTNTVHQMYRGNLTQSIGGDYTLTIFVKAAGRSGLTINEAFSIGGGGYFNLTSVTATTLAPAKNSTITAVGNGWYRCSTTWTFVANANIVIYFILVDNSGNTTYQGDGTSGVYLWGAQLEAGQVASTYTPTTSSIVTTLNRTYVGSGNAANPGLAFNRDPSTGLWSPAAGVLALSTAGSERVRVDSSGNVGIGTSSPAYKLEVTGTSYFSDNLGLAAQKQLRLNGPVDGAQSIRYNVTLDGIQIQGYGGIAFLTSAGSGTERVRISANGGFSIGTTTDAGAGNLLVNGTVTSSAYITSSSNITTDATTTRTLSASDNGKTIYFTSSSAITLTTQTGLGAGFSCIIIQAGTGQVTVTAGSSTTVNSYGALVNTAGQYAMINIFAPVADSFILSGQLA